MSLSFVYIAVYCYEALFFVSLYYIPSIHAALLQLSSILCLPHKENREEVMAGFLSQCGTIIMCARMVSQSVFRNGCYLASLLKKISFNVVGIAIEPENNEPCHERVGSENKEDNQHMKDDNPTTPTSGGSGYNPECNQTHKNCDYVVPDREAKQIKDDNGSTSHKALTSIDSADDSSCSEDASCKEDSTFTQKKGVQCAMNMMERSQYIEDGNGSGNSLGPVYARGSSSENINSSDCEDGNGDNKGSPNEMLGYGAPFDLEKEHNQQVNEDCNIIRRDIDKKMLNSAKEPLDKSGKNISSREAVDVLPLKDKKGNYSSPTHYTSLVQMQKGNCVHEGSSAFIREASTENGWVLLDKDDRIQVNNTPLGSSKMKLIKNFHGLVKKLASNKHHQE